MSRPGDLADYGRMGFSLVAKESAGASETVLRATLADVQRVTSPYEMPDAFFTGSNGFLLIFVGDITQSEPWLQPDGAWNPDYDGRGLHLLAIPFDFTL